MNQHDVDLAREYFRFYKSVGYNPLPSRTDEKRPMCKFAQYWDQPIPDDLFDRFPSTNLQLVCGRKFRLMIIDLDGPEAVERWQQLGRHPKTWVTHSGSGGFHYWFRVPAEGPPLPKAVLWKGKGDHQAIERLCDRSLVIAPPSLHIVTGERYRFTAYHSKRDIAIPADAPAWLLRMRPIEAKKAPAVRREPFPSMNEVLSKVYDKIALAQSWGLRFASYREVNGWVKAHAVDRPDNHPSCSFHAETGTLYDHATGRRLSLFELGVELGRYTSWQEAANDLRRRA